MATETLELKTPELAYDSPPKQEDCVANSDKDAPVSEDDAEEKKKKKEEEVEKDEAKDEAMEEEKGEENDGERKEKEPVTPISERPVRERKRTERYSLDTPPRSSGNKPVSIEQGRGTRLKEIPNVAYKLSKRKPDDNLFLLHTILYGKKGKAHMLKKNIGQFSGFVWSEQEEEKQRARAKEKLEKCIKEKLIDFCDMLDIPINKSNVKKEELAVRVLEFLVYPKATRDIVLADSEKKTKKRKKITPKNITSGEASDVPAKRRKQVKKSGKKQDQPTETEEENGEADVDSEGTNDSHGEDDVAPEKENNKNTDTETEDKKDKAEKKKSTDKKKKDKAEKKKSTDKKSSSKRTKKEKPAPEEEKSLKGSAKSGPKKSSKEVDKSTLSSSKKQKVEKDDSSKEKGKKQSKEKGKKQTSKPQAKGSKDQGKARKKGKTEPTRKQMHVVVAKILKEVDFNTATLSDILRKLGNHFGVDLMHRKTEVKDIITDAINEMSDDEREENTEDEGMKEKEDEERKD